MQMLSEVISFPTRVPPSPAVLLREGLQSGQQSCQPSTLALHARERRLLPRPGERRPGPGVAVAPSWVLAPSSTCRRCVTRSLNGRTHWFSTIKTANLVRSPLQEILIAQPAVLIGLIAHIVGTPCKMTSSAPRTVCYDWAKTFSLHPRRGRQTPVPSGGARS